MIADRCASKCRVRIAHPTNVRILECHSREGGNDKPRNFVGQCPASRIDHRQSLRQLLKQRFGFGQIFRVEAFGKPVVNRL